MIRGRRPRRPTRVFIMRPRRNQITYDYLITNDAEWATVFGLGAATLSGKTIAVAPGNYTSKTIASFNPASTVRVISASASSKPQIDVLFVDGSSKLQLENIRIVSSTWASGTAAALRFVNAVSDFAAIGCEFVGNYRGVIGDPSFDLTVSTYPEYASIRPVFNSSGVVTGFDVNRPTVGSLLADGTGYAMIFGNYGGITFTVSPVATFDVVGGQIVNPVVVSGGSSNASDTTGAGIRSALVTWTGQRRMVDWMPSAWRSTGGSTMSGTIRFQDCSIDFCNHGFKPLSSSGANIIVDNCTFDRIYQDFMSFSGMSPITVRDVFATRPFAAGDAGDPHTDLVQLVHSGSGNWPDIVLERNIFVQGVARGSVQGWFISDATTGNYVNPRIVGNAFINTSSANGLSLSRPNDGLVYANLVCRYDPTDTSRNVSQAVLDLTGTSSGDVFVANNISEFVEPQGGSISYGGLPNVELGLNGATISYGDVFANHTGPRSTKSQVVSAYSPKIAYAGRGPFANTAYIDHVNRTTNLTLEPSMVRFTAISAQTTSTLVTSEWSRIQGGPLTGNTISVTGGEYRIADDASGTNATAWTSTAGTYARDKFLQLRHTTSASGSTDTATTVTLRGSYSYTFVSTTASVLSFTMVDNQTTAYSTFSVATLTGETGIRKVVLAIRCKPDAITANANIFAVSNAVAQRFWFPTTGAFRYQFANGTTANLRPALAPTTDAKTHIITLDFTQSSGGCYWATIEDGLLLDNTPGTGGTFATGGGTSSFSANGTNQMFGTDLSFGLFAQGNGTGTLFDGAIGFFWMDWGGSSYTIPDITQSSVRNKWLADLIGSDGSGPTGSQPKLFYTGSVAEWNAGFANLGSLTARPLNKQTATYV